MPSPPLAQRSCVWRDWGRAGLFSQTADSCGSVRVVAECLAVPASVVSLFFARTSWLPLLPVSLIEITVPPGAQTSHVHPSSLPAIWDTDFCLGLVLGLELPNNYAEYCDKNS